MALEIEAIDVTDVPELRRIAEEVRDTREPRVLRAGDEDVAVVMPVPRRRGRKRQRTEADDATFRSSFGGWRGLVDGERLKRGQEEARGSDRPLVKLSG